MPEPQDRADDDGGAQIYDNVRHAALFGTFLGCRLVDVTQTDRDEVERGEPMIITLHFDNGHVVEFPITDAGFNVETDD